LNVDPGISQKWQQNGNQEVFRRKNTDLKTDVAAGRL
jgi:hypothetical protein